MKKLLIAAIVAGSLIGMQAMAAVSLFLGAGNLYESDGVTFAPLNTVGLWIVDTSGGTSLTPTLTLGESIALGATLAGTSDKIIDVEDANNSNFGVGGINFGFSGAYGSGLGAGLASGQKFGIIWLINQSLSQTTTVAGQYGEFSDYAGAYSNPWILPADPTPLASYDMTTTANGGSVPESAGIANLTIVPEPSSIMLVVVGLLGGIGLIRRRS